MSDPVVPDGFVPHTRTSPLTTPWAPIYRCNLPDRVYLGLHLRRVHCNSRGLVHGGFIAALSDNAMGYTCGRALQAAGRPITGLVTISLTMDYLGSAALGQWMSWEPELLRAGRSVAFVQALITADGKRVARASASFKVTDTPLKAE